ncbi:23078_t:CDS:2, partial [Cetraspora pellucida]
TNYAATLQVELSQELEANTSTLNLNFRPTQNNSTIASTASVANIPSYSLTTTIKSMYSFIAETSIHSSTFTTCCAEGKIQLPPFLNLPSSLNMLLTRMDSEACLFRQKIRMYNSALAFTSMSVTIDYSIIGTSGHKLQNKMSVMSKLDPQILATLQQMLHDINPYCRIFNQATNILNLNSIFNFKMVITNSRSKDSRHYNILTASEVAPNSIVNYNPIVSAKISDANTDLCTFKTIKCSMMHGPCSALMPNASCMKNKHCSKGYPKLFQEKTAINNDGYLVYM